MIKDKKIYWLKKLSRYNLNILVLENCILNIKDKDKIYFMKTHEIITKELLLMHTHELTLTS